MNKGMIDKFHREYYRLDIQSKLTWMGRPIVKTPHDQWVMQEILYETRPEIIVETGVFKGGSALFYAHMFDIIGGPGEVVSIDIAFDPEFEYPKHDRIELLLGMSSISPKVMDIVRERVDGKRTMVILDSDHACDHVLQELRLYAPLVSKGCYLIVEDTNVNGYPAMALHGPGPMEAVKAFQPTNNGFEVDRSREKFLISFHPNGFLKRVR